MTLLTVHINFQQRSVNYKNLQFVKIANLLKFYLYKYLKTKKVKEKRA